MGMGPLDSNQKIGPENEWQQERIDATPRKASES